MSTAAILGASGYAGGELVRFLDAHASFELTFLGAHSKAGRPLGDVHPHLVGGERILGDLDSPVATQADVVFLALPHGTSSAPALAARRSGSKVVDLGSDFRLDTPARYRAAYGADHPFPRELGQWVYGLPEIFGDDIAGADQVAAPGCYPTSVLLALAPLLERGLIHAEGIIADSMSGVSGAGRSASDGLMFGTVDESVRAYKVLDHRHQPEMERVLDVVGDAPSRVIFTPHLVPMQRGILSTVYAATTSGVTLGDLEAAIDDAYASAAFVSRVPASPETRWVVGSNNALISVHIDERSGTAVLVSAIDNLVKGAAGQAVQCANLMFGYNESEGLPRTGWMP